MAAAASGRDPPPPGSPLVFSITRRDPYKIHIMYTILTISSIAIFLLCNFSFSDYYMRLVYKKTSRSKDSTSAFLLLAELRIEAQLNVYLLNSYQTDIYKYEMTS